MKLREVGKVPKTEFSQTFVQGMLDRMNMSYFKYGAIAEAYPIKIDAIQSLQQRLQKYSDTGNTEYLMDVANFAMIEFLHPKHPQAFFEPTDSDRSPGRVHASGVVSQTANTVDRENIRLGGSKLTTMGGFYQHEGD